MSQPSRSHFRMFVVEPLECRRMLVWVATFDAGVLTFIGTPGDDQIQEIRGQAPTGGGADVVWWDQEVPGPPPAIVSVETPILAAGVKEIRIWGRAGDDKVFLEDGFPGIDPLEALKIWGESGDDWVRSVPPGEVLHPTHPLSRDPYYNIFFEGWYGENTFEGKDDPEEIHGSFDPDHLWGAGDNDLVDAGPGKDEEVGGGTGNDRVVGGTGDDKLFGDEGQDAIEGNEGNDTIDGGDGADVLWSNFPSGAVDQPWQGLDGTPGWFDMNGSGPDTDGDCDIEDGHADLDGWPCAPGALIARDDAIGVSHGATIVPPGGINVLLNDTYAAPGPPAIIVTNPPAHGAFTMNTDGTFSYDPNNTFVGVDSFVYYISQSGQSNAYPAIVAINVSNANPYANNDGGGTVSRTQPTSFDVTANDSDLDPGDQPALVVDQFLFTQGAGLGSAQIDPADAGKIKFTPNGGTGSVSIQY